MGKNSSPNLGKWKDIRYNLLVEQENDWYNEEPNEPHQYTLKNGKVLEVDESGGPGMAGEPMTFITLEIDGKTVHFDDIKHLMQPNDAKYLEQYLNDSGDSNDASARSWVEGKTPKYFDVAKWRETQKNRIKETTLKEDGGTYTVQITIVDFNTSYSVRIKDNQDFSETSKFQTIAELKEYLTEYLDSMVDA